MPNQRQPELPVGPPAPSADELHRQDCFEVMLLRLAHLRKSIEQFPVDGRCDHRAVSKLLAATSRSRQQILQWSERY